MSPSREDMQRETEGFYTAMNNRDLNDVLSRLADGVVDHQLPPEMPNGKESSAAFFTMMFDSSPDLRFEILDMLISGNKVAIRSRVTGTQTGPFLQIPATGKPFDVEDIDIFEMNDDLKITQLWGIFDLAGMMEQVGLAPAPPS